MSKSHSDPSTACTPPAPIDIVVGSRAPTPAAEQVRKPTRTTVKVTRLSEITHFKILKFSLLNVRSVGNDTESGQINDFIVNEALDCLASTEMWLRPDNC